MNREKLELIIKIDEILREKKVRRHPNIPGDLPVTYLSVEPNPNGIGAKLIADFTYELQIGFLDVKELKTVLFELEKLIIHEDETNKDKYNGYVGAYLANPLDMRRPEFNISKTYGSKSMDLQCVDFDLNGKNNIEEYLNDFANRRKAYKDKMKKENK